MQDGSVAYNEFKSELLATVPLIVHAYNPDSWKNNLRAALAWGLVEVCFRCKRLHPPVGADCDSKNSTEYGLEVCHLKEKDKTKQMCFVCK